MLPATRYYYLSRKIIFLREPKFISIYFKLTAANKCTYTFEAHNKEGLKVKMRQGSNKHYDYQTMLLSLIYKLRNKFDRFHFIKIINFFCTQLRKTTWYFRAKENFHQNSNYKFIIKINSVGNFGRKKIIV